MVDQGGVDPARGIAPTRGVENARLRPPHPLDAEWWVHSDGEVLGPFTGHQLRAFIGEGRITRSTDIVKVGSETWSLAGDDPVIGRLFPRSAPAIPAREPAAVSGPVSAAPGATVVQVTNTITSEAPQPILVGMGEAKPKSAGTALLLSILICGAGQMYNGQIGKGIGMLVLCVLLWFVFLGWIINIWSWIDAYRTAKAMNERYYRLLAAGAVI